MAGAIETRRLLIYGAPNHKYTIWNNKTNSNYNKWLVIYREKRIDFVLFDFGRL